MELASKSTLFLFLKRILLGLKKMLLIILRIIIYDSSDKNVTLCQVRWYQLQKVISMSFTHQLHDVTLVLRLSSYVTKAKLLCLKKLKQDG